MLIYQNFTIIDVHGCAESAQRAKANAGVYAMHSVRTNTLNNFVLFRVALKCKALGDFRN